MTDHQYTEIMKRFDTIEAALFNKNTRKPSGMEDPRPNLLQFRISEIERIFWKLVNAPAHKRRSSYRFPSCLIEHATKPHFEGVVVSVLLNQVSLRKCFQNRGKDDIAKETPLECARRILDKTNLVVLPMNMLRMEYNSNTLVALSPAQAEVSAKSTAKLPNAWRGWTCTERAEMHPSPKGGFLEPLADPSGERKWSSAGDSAGVARDEAKRKVPFAEAVASGEIAQVTPRKIAFGSTSDDEEEEEEEDESPPPEAPVTGFRTRVQFVNEEDEQ